MRWSDISDKPLLEVDRNSYGREENNFYDDDYDNTVRKISKPTGKPLPFNVDGFEVRASRTHFGGDLLVEN